MASQSITPRVVLGEKNVNTPITRISGSALAITDSSSPEKSDKMGQVSLSYTSFGGKNAKATSENTPLGESKRSSLMVEDIQNSPKRRKTESGVQAGALHPARTVQGDDGSISRTAELHQRNFLSPGRVDNESSQLSSPSLSPTSSFGNDTSDLNETQNTIITEPDQDLLAVTTFPAARRPTIVLTPEQLRAKARAIRLRLSLASYKVRTNQINVPMSRLEIRSSTSLQKLPSLSRANSSAYIITQRRTALPAGPKTSLPTSAASNQAGQESQASTDNIPSSPPSQYIGTPRLMSPSKNPANQSRGGFATPILPRQTASMLNPPQLSPSTGVGNDLTSSVVKGRAADGLLSLMRQ